MSTRRIDIVVVVKLRPRSTVSQHQLQDLANGFAECGMATHMRDMMYFGFWPEQEALENAEHNGYMLQIVDAIMTVAGV